MEELCNLPLEKEPAMKFIVQWIVCAIAVGVAAWIVPGFSVGMTAQTWVAVAALGLVLALLNGSVKPRSVKPLLQAISLPVTILTMGIFYLIVNTAVLYLAAWLVNGIFGIAIVFLSFGSAFAASVVIVPITVLAKDVSRPLRMPVS